MVELFKIYKMNGNNYTIPIYFEDFYIFIIEVAGAVALASKDLVIRRPLYTGVVSFFETSFDKLTNGQKAKVIEVVFGELGWK